jgi:hypothetical protein
MAADRIHIAEPAPPRCSACFQAKPQEAHVDFSASYDGPVVPALDGAAGVVGHMIDELILCSECIRTAAVLVGMGDAGAVIAERDQLEAGNRELRSQLAGYKDYTDKLEAANQARPPDRTGMREAPRRQARTAGKR